MQSFLLLTGLALLISSNVFAAGPEQTGVTDFFVPHFSKLPANNGELVGLHVRRVVDVRGPVPKNVVLFVHGGSVPAVPAFGFQYKDYDWLAFMARGGFDVYAMDLTGYGSSPRPRMDDPCNVSAKQQDILKGRPIKSVCDPSFPFDLTTNSNEWGEIDSVVDYIRKISGVEKLNIIGWSVGGVRVGGYVSLHPEKIVRAVLYAPTEPTPGLIVPDTPASGVPTALQTRSDLEKLRWDPDVRCDGQLDPELRSALWTEIMKWDAVGASWGPINEGVMRSPNISHYGWPDEMVARIKVPTLVIYGEYDRPEKRKRTYDLISGTADKVSVRIACASHFMLWEKQHTILQKASLEWLAGGHVHDIRRGELVVDRNGSFSGP